MAAMRFAALAVLMLQMLPSLATTAEEEATCAEEGAPGEKKAQAMLQVKTMDQAKTEAEAKTMTKTKTKTKTKIKTRTGSKHKQASAPCVATISKYAEVCPGMKNREACEKMEHCRWEGTVPEVEPEPVATNCTSVKVSVITDNYPGETSWNIKDSRGEVLQGLEGSGPSKLDKAACVQAPGSYTFTIEDGYGDGICCGYGEGSFTISVLAPNAAERSNTYTSFKNSSMTIKIDVP